MPALSPPDVRIAIFIVSKFIVVKKAIYTVTHISLAQQGVDSRSTFHMFSHMFDLLVPKFVSDLQHNNPANDG